MRLARTLIGSVLAGALVLSAGPAMAATITWDWTVFGATNPSGDATIYGNSRSLTVGGIKVTATGWGYTADTYGTDTAFENAGLGAYSSGLGVCNRQEDTTSPYTANGCVSPAHAVGNNGAAKPDDFVLFLFTDAGTGLPVTVDPKSVYINQFGDTDVSYWLGTVAGPVDLATYQQSGTPFNTTLASLGFGTRVDEPGPTATSRYVYIPPPDGVGGTLANAILFGAQVGMTDDYFKIKSITANTVPPPPSVPEPVALVLVGLGMAGLRTYRRRAAAQS